MAKEIITEATARHRMELPANRRTFAHQIVKVINRCNPFPHGGPLWTRTNIVLESDGKTVGEIRKKINEAGWPKINGTCRTLLKIGLVEISDD